MVERLMLLQTGVVTTGSIVWMPTVSAVPRMSTSCVGKDGEFREQGEERERTHRLEVQDMLMHRARKTVMDVVSIVAVVRVESGLDVCARRRV
jgi:hypothetical protein